jgi:FKBP-type peptidyl-prolyl cis-trans isomerase SlyD
MRSADTDIDIDIDIDTGSWTADPAASTLSDPAGEDKVVGIHYTMRDDAGTLLGHSDRPEPLHYLHGSGKLPCGLETAIDGRRPGELFHVTVPPEQGYGPRRTGGERHISRARFPDDLHLEIGMRVGIDDGPDGGISAWITGIDDEFVTIDFNHPLSGKQLHFEILVVSTRDATEEERDHGHAHPVGGHLH